MEDIAYLARKFAIRNAMEYGRADEKAVLGKVMGRSKEAREDVEAARRIVGRVVSEVNGMGKEALESAFAEHAEEFSEFDRQRVERTAKPRMELPGAAKGMFVTRFPPEPSGYMHLGHAKPAWLEREFADIYEGKVGLYFDDSNPENEKQEYVDAFKEDLEWLGIKFDREYYASDSIEELYRHAEELISKGGAYVCTCSPARIKELRLRGEGCQHKLQHPEDNLSMWKRMLGGKMQGSEAVLRLNAVMEDENTAMRDPTLFRIKHHRHYRQGVRFCVWPTYDFNTPVMDSMSGVTDAIRSKEYELRDKTYYTVLDRLGLRKPRVHSISRLNIKGNITSKRRINALIKEGRIKGYDDPRLVTIRALRRRGISPKAIKEFVLKAGMSKAEGEMSLEHLIIENRGIVDKDALRLFAVEEPVLMHVSKGDASPSLQLHPSRKEAGARSYKVRSEVYVSRKDAAEGDVVRLKGLYDARVLSVDMGKITAERLEGAKPAKTIQWVPVGETTYATLQYIGEPFVGDDFNPDSLRDVKVLAENYVSRLSEGDIVQFERIGYFKLDNKKEMRFLSL